jgi:hypothetical protein
MEYVLKMLAIARCMCMHAISRIGIKFHHAMFSFIYRNFCRTLTLQNEGSRVRFAIIFSVCFSRKAKHGVHFHCLRKHACRR